MEMSDLMLWDRQCAGTFPSATNWNRASRRVPSFGEALPLWCSYVRDSSGNPALRSAGTFPSAIHWNEVYPVFE